MFEPEPFYELLLFLSFLHSLFTVQNTLQRVESGLCSEDTPQLLFTLRRHWAGGSGKQESWTPWAPKAVSAFMTSFTGEVEVTTEQNQEESETEQQGWRRVICSLVLGLLE